MPYYLPLFFPPIAPTHQLVYVPPIPLPTPTRYRHSVADHDCVLRTYEMTMRQQPVQARMCGVGEKSDRRPVDPTPIIQLKVIDGNGDEVPSADTSSRDSSESSKRKSLRRPDAAASGMSFMQNPYYFLFACLVGGDEQDDELHLTEDGKTRFLTGTPVSSLYHLKDLDNSDAAFFVFPDLGVRKEGRYKLKLTLFEIVDQEVYYCTTMHTSTFSVFSAKKFPGMQRATDLSKTFAEQGLKIRVRKDPRRRSNKPKRKSDANESDEEALELPKRPRNQSTSHHPVSVYPEAAYYPRHSGPYPYGPPPPGEYDPNVHPYHPGGPMPPPPLPYDPYRVQYPYPNYGRPVTHPGPSPYRIHHSAGPSGYHHYPDQPGGPSHQPYPPVAYHPPPPGPYELRSHGHGVPWPLQQPPRHPQHPQPPPPPRETRSDPLLSRGLPERRVPAQTSPTRSTRSSQRHPSPVRLPSLNPNANPTPLVRPASSSRSVASENTGQPGGQRQSEGSGRLLENSARQSERSVRPLEGSARQSEGSVKREDDPPDTSKGGSKGTTNRMGLGHLMD